MIDILHLALDELGVEEIPGTESNPRIDEYLKSVGQPSDDAIPWCAAFVNWCIEKSGYMGTGRPNARSFLHWGKELKNPELGCVTVFSRGASTWQGHVGFFLSKIGSSIYVLGGNQGNRVCVKAYPVSRLLGYRDLA